MAAMAMDYGNPALNVPPDIPPDVPTKVRFFGWTSCRASDTLPMELCQNILPKTPKTLDKLLPMP